MQKLWSFHYQTIELKFEFCHAFLFLSREDLKSATQLLYNHFRRFGLAAHTGSKKFNSKSKTEAACCSPSHLPSESIEEKTTDAIFDDGDTFTSFTTDFCCLGNILNGKLDDAQDAEKQIQKANHSFWLMSKRTFFDRSISLPARIKTHNSAIANSLLWGCES